MPGNCVFAQHRCLMATCLISTMMHPRLFANTEGGGEGGKGGTGDRVFTDRMQLILTLLVDL